MSSAKEEMAPPKGAAPSKNDQSLSLPTYLAMDRPRGPRQEESFIGREQELVTLEKHMQQALEGQGDVVFITSVIALIVLAIIHIGIRIQIIIKGEDMMWNSYYPNQWLAQI